MGYMRHHAIVITGWDKTIEKAHKKASKLFQQVSPLTDVAMNGYRSFFIPPDGSKEGWGVSQEGDEAREKMIKWLRKKVYEDGSSPLDWVEVQYGDDDKRTEVCSHSDEGGW